MALTQEENQPESVDIDSADGPESTDGPEETFLKHELDLSFAITLLRSGKATQRQLSKALDGWTIYGSQSLADRVHSQRIVSFEEKETLQAESRRNLQAVSERAGQGGRQNSTLISRTRIAMLDSSGRMSRLLGLNDSQSVMTDEVNRELNSQFTLIRKLGEGGLGTVWLARDENLRRYVAIKEIRGRDKQETAAVIARFRREAEVTGRLEHPGIVPIYQFGTDGNTGRYFYVMRFLGKQTMLDAITQYHERREAGSNEPLLMHRLLTSFVKLCNSVAHAHSRKVVHRDLKPENVALDSFGQVVLLDWGLAKINDETGAAEAALEAEADETIDINLTMASQVLGSPMYMAPEQATGRIEEVDDRTDVYGLGGILFSILTGQSPHEHAREESGSSMADLLASIVGTPVKRVRDLNSSVCPELDAICFKAMQKKRYLRYNTASAIAEDVERYMAGDKVSAYNEPPMRRTVRWITAHPRLSQAGGLLAMAGLLTMFVVGYTWRTTQLAQESFQFQKASDIVKELSFTLQAEADALIADTRFVSALPPVQGIIDAKNNRDTEGESDSVWRDRLGSVYTELLRNHPSYLAVAFLSLGDDVSQLVRVERNRSIDTIRRVPDSRLTAYPRQKDGPNFDLMLPGDVMIRSSDRINENAPTQFRDALSLSAANAVLDETSGELFGFAAIQIDLRRVLQQRIKSIGTRESDVFITDGNGQIQIAFTNGDFSPLERGKSVIDIVPELENMFGEKAVDLGYSNDSTVYAKRVLLGGESALLRATIGIVIQVK